jgi:hypothetical protein
LGYILGDFFITNSSGHPVRECVRQSAVVLLLGEREREGEVESVRARIFVAILLKVF